MVTRERRFWNGPSASRQAAAPHVNRTGRALNRPRGSWLKGERCCRHIIGLIARRAERFRSGTHRRRRIHASAMSNCFALWRPSLPRRCWAPPRPARPRSLTPTRLTRPTASPGLAYLEGDVGLLPSGDRDWSEARVNRPLTRGDVWPPRRGARAELNWTAPPCASMAGPTSASSQLDDRLAQFELTQGTLDLTVRRLAAARATRSTRPPWRSWWTARAASASTSTATAAPPASPPRRQRHRVRRERGQRPVSAGRSYTFRRFPWTQRRAEESPRRRLRSPGRTHATGASRSRPRAATCPRR